MLLVVGYKTQLKSVYYSVRAHQLVNNLQSAEISVAVMLAYLQNNLLLACVCLSLYCFGATLCKDSRLVKNMCDVLSDSFPTLLVHWFPVQIGVPE